MFTAKCSRVAVYPAARETLHLHVKLRLLEPIRHPSYIFFLLYRGADATCYTCQTAARVPVRANTQFNLSNVLRHHEQRLSIITFCPFLSGVILCLEISLSCSVFRKKKNSIRQKPLDGYFHNGSFVTFFYMHFY